MQEREHIQQIAFLISPAVNPPLAGTDSGRQKQQLEILPTLLFYLMDTTKRDPGENFFKLGLVSVGAALANLVQAASEKGMAVQPFTFACGKESYVSNLRNYLRIPEKVVICGFLGVGYLKDQKNPAGSITADKPMVHDNFFGIPRKIGKLNPNPFNQSPFFLIRERKSYRQKFLDRPISLRDEDRLIKAAMDSCDGKRRTWELIFIKNKDLINSFADLITKISFDLYLETEYTERMKAWTRYTLKEEREKTDGVLIVLWKKFLGHLLKGMVLGLEKFTILKPLRMFFFKIQSKEFFGKLVRQSPLLIAFIYRKKELENSKVSYLANLINVGMTVQNILLAGTARNMGAQFLTVMLDTEEGTKQAKKLLQLPDDVEVVEMIRIGYIDPSASNRLLSLSNTLRRPVDKIAHREFYSFL